MILWLCDPWLCDMQGTSFHVRMGVNSCVGALGVLGVALSGNISFAFAVASVTLIGTMSSFGESVLLGYLKYYPASMTGAWSSGTGAAGVVGSAFYLALHGAGVSNTIIFYTMLPPILAYWWAFAWLLKKPETATSNGAGRRGSYSLLQTGAAAEAPRREVEVSQHLTHDVNSVERGVSREPVAAQPQGGAGAAACVVDSGDGAGVVTLARAWKAIGLVWWHGVNLLLVYFFEYVVSVGGAAKANPPSTPSSSWWERNSYAILAFCYQFGVLLSRSSLSVVRIHKFGWLTLLQAVNFVLWLIQDEYHFAGLPIQFIAMVYVGLIGGGMYVNVFAELVEDPNIPPRDRELCINIASVFNNLGKDSMWGVPDDSGLMHV